MRHLVQKRHFNRDTNHRKALLMNLVRSLMEQGKIVTTQAKAKEVKRLADKYLSKAKTNSIVVRRQLHQVFGKRDVVNVMVDRIAPAMKDRTSGFTTMSVVGKRRGDNSIMVKLELVEKPEGLGSLKSGKTYPKKTKAKPSTKKATKKVAKKTEKKQPKAKK